MNGSHIYFDHGTYESEHQIAEQKRRQQLRYVIAILWLINVLFLNNTFLIDSSTTKNQVKDCLTSNVALKLTHRSVKIKQVQLFSLNCRESSVELRELENKLRQAYINKELYAQLCERRKKEKIREEQVKNFIRFDFLLT